MSIPMNYQCYLCHFNKHVDTARRYGTEAQVTAFARDLMELYLSAPENTSLTWFGTGTNALYQKYFTLPEDRFLEEKELSNRFVIERMDLIRQKVESAEDPVFAGLQFSILGNYLDFAALQGQVSFEKLEAMLDTAFDLELDKEAYADFCKELETGKKLLYLTDNAGEIGFDRIFAEEIAKKYPQLEITFCVRGEIIINDATRADAEAVGIPFPVIDNGNRVPGTQIDLLGQEALDALNSADVILAKGMANCETMFGCGYNVYYAFLVKCQRFVDRFRKPMLTPMLVKERA